MKIQYLDDVTFVLTETNIEGVKFVKYENAKAMFELQSGNYKFSSIN